MKYLGYLVIIIIMLVLNFGVLAPLGLGWAVPSTILLLVLCIGLEYGSLDFFFFAVIGGLWMDVYFALPIGSFTGAYILAGLAGWLMFQRLLLTEANWKYYLLFVVAAELMMLAWLWAYTNILFVFHWTPLAVSGAGIRHHFLALFVSALAGAFPIYIIVNYTARKARQWLRQPLKL
jgi:hypothetical protein